MTIDHWRPGEPNGGASENCVLTHPTTEWIDSSCAIPRVFICQVPKVPSYHPKCPEGFEFMYYQCYKYHPVAMTQPEAVAFCPTLYPGAKLYEPKLHGIRVLTTMGEKDDRTGENHKRWVGINDRDNEGTHVFESDSTPITGFFNFKSGYPADANPEDDCALSQATHWRYQDAPCDDLATFYCEVPMSVENYVEPFEDTGDLWNKWVDVEVTLADVRLCAEACSDRSSPTTCEVFAFIEPDRCFLGDWSPQLHNTDIVEAAAAKVYVRRALDIDSKYLSDYVRLTKVNGTEWTRWMKRSFPASTFEECVMICEADSEDCDAFTFINEDGICYVGDLRVRTTFGVYAPRPRIVATVYTKHGEINTEADRSVYWDSRLYDDLAKGQAAGVHKNRDSCEFINDGHGNIADPWTANFFIPWGQLGFPALILDLHGQVEILKVLLIRSTASHHNNRGLKDFRVDVSSDLHEWRSVLKSQVTHIPFQWACSTTYQPLEQIVVTKLTVGRYLLLTPLTSWHGGGEPVAIKYFGAETSEIEALIILQS